MEKLKIKGVGDRNVWVHKISTPYNLEKMPFNNEPYICLTVGLNKKINTRDLKKIAKRLIDSNCIYSVSAGKKCKEMELEVDVIFVNKMGDKDYGDKEMVMTTSHSNEKIEEVVWFFFTTANHPYYIPAKNYLILFIGENDKEEKKWLRKLKEHHKYKKLVDEGRV